MSSIVQRPYKGPIKAVVFDWAGTTIDYGCCAPAGAFIALFARHGVTATQEQARGPMGMHKRDHIAAMLGLPEIEGQWSAVHGKPPADSDVEALFQEFIPMQLDVLPGYCELIPGAVETVNALRARGIKIGATTGYNAAMMNICADAAARAGYVPDVSVDVTRVPAGRPAPWMAVLAAMEMNVYPFESIVKVGDTVTDIEEGLNAGMWSVGVVKHGNEVGLPRAEVEALEPADLQQRMNRARKKFADAGAHYVIDTIADLPALIDTIEKRIAQG
jgi:phosphonoacetaldehyde hydrolase